MKCKKCGAELGDKTKCADCGEDNTAKKIDFKTRDFTGEFDTAEAKDKKVMAILAYLGFLVFIPIFAAKDSKYARFHANQGLVLFILEMAIAIVDIILTAIFAYVWVVSVILSVVFWLLWIGLTVLAIVGIVNAVNEKAKELPLIGKMRILK
ncbi:MAG: zinc ribbon domain-containing protein [Clostridia bacterium]|nr:zinc ribbon domain-containing protein [Clostridia bacterium]